MLGARPRIRWPLLQRGSEVRLGPDYVFVSSPGKLAVEYLPYALLGARRLSAKTSHALLLRRAQPPFGISVAVCAERRDVLCSGTEDALLLLARLLELGHLRHRKDIGVLPSLKQVFERVTIGVKSVVYETPAGSAEESPGSPPPASGFRLYPPLRRRLLRRGLTVRTGPDYFLVSGPGRTALEHMPYALLDNVRINAKTSHVLLLKRSEPPLGLAVAACTEGYDYLCSGAEDALLKLVGLLGLWKVRFRKDVGLLPNLARTYGRYKVGMKSVVYG